MVFSRRHVKKIEGFAAPGFESVRQIFEREMNTIAEKEAQLCVYHKGHKVIDLWAHPIENSDFNADSLVPVFSSGKSLEALGLAHLVDIGLLDYDANISKYWPEFAAHEKENITVADLMRHEAGLVEFKHTFQHDELFTENIKRNSVGSVIENVKRRMSDNSLFHRQYHGATRGWIANELFRRVEPQGRTLGEYIRDDIAQPLEIDVNIGLDEEHHHRRAAVKPFSIAFHVIESLRPRVLGRRVVHNAKELYFIVDAVSQASLRDLHARFMSMVNKPTDTAAIDPSNRRSRKKNSPMLPMVFGLNGPLKGL